MNTCLSYSHKELMLFFITPQKKSQRHALTFRYSVDMSHLVSGVRSHHRHSVIAFSQEYTQSIQFALWKDDQHIIPMISDNNQNIHIICVHWPAVQKKSVLSVYSWLCQTVSAPLFAPDVSLWFLYRKLYLLERQINKECIWWGITPAQQIPYSGVSSVHVWFLLPSIQLTNMLGN